MSEPKFIGVGPDFGNECCACGIKTSYAAPPGGNDACSDMCTGNLLLNKLYKLGDESTEGVCFPFSCCPCPSTGTGELTASISVRGGSERYGKCHLNLEVQLSPELGVPMCSGGDIPGFAGSNVPCYSQEGDEFDFSNKGSAYEKYGFTGLLIAPSGDCDGRNADITLCCCDLPGAQGPVDGQASCHMCNYQFTLDFPVRACDCPECDAEPCPTPMLPGNAEGESSADWPGLYNNFILKTGSCDPFILEFERTGLYWNCNGCLNGDQATDNNVSISITIVET